ncbi:bleomycin hydrolase [Blomia tropicalis]|nr:bleomycin hydrolase [Blomia tropicalis]
MGKVKKAVLLGVYENSNDPEGFVFTPIASKINNLTNGLLEQNIKLVGPLKKNKVLTFFGLHAEYPAIAVTGLGSMNASYNELEEVDEKRENVRSSIAAGVLKLREIGAFDTIDIDPCNDAMAAAEGSNLAVFYYDDLKSESLKKKRMKFNLIQNEESDNEKWITGTLNAEGQNLCRWLKETPANLMTPTIFAQVAVERLSKLGVTVQVRDRKWAESMGMGSFLSVSNGSEQPPVFLEMHYNNAPNTKPVVFVGKGITFDSGGISIKQSADMDRMRADMGGAANVLATIYTLASKKAPVNIIGLTPLTENLPSGRATKPGDVVTAMNGKTIQVDNTDAEGRLVLADGLCYAHKFDPLLILDIATLTGAIGVALGSSATGVFTTSSKYWDVLHKCGIETGDRVWRMPLFKHFTKQVVDSQLADLDNLGKYRGKGGSCVAAAFLKEFVVHPNWMHLDIAGVMDNKDEVTYLNKGMSGRPMRTLVKFVEDIFNNKMF